MEDISRATPEKPFEEVRAALDRRIARSETLFPLLVSHLAELRKAVVDEALKPETSSSYVPLGPIQAVHNGLAHAYNEARRALSQRRPSEIVREKGFMGSPAVDQGYEAQIAQASDTLQEKIINVEHWLGLRPVLAPHPKDRQR